MIVEEAKAVATDAVGVLLAEVGAVLVVVVAAAAVLVVVVYVE